MIILNGDTPQPAQAIRREDNPVWFHDDPLVELVASLHVLSDPEHHETCRSWVIRTNSIIGKSLRNEINYFAMNYNRWLFVMDIVTDLACEGTRTGEAGQELDILWNLKQFRNMDNVGFAYLFLGMGAFGFERDTLKKWMKDPEAVPAEEFGQILTFISENNIRFFLRNIDNCKDRLYNVISHYWNKVFSDTWSAAEQQIKKIIRQQQEIAQRQPLIDYILSIHPGMDVEKGRLVLKKEVDYSMDADKISRVHIFPSMFTAPHLMMDILGTELVLYYNLDLFSIMAMSDVPEGLLEGIKTLGDGSRMKILKILWENEATTQRLAAILDLAPSTVSVHLKMLKKAELVTGRQSKKFVYYEANKEKVEALWTELKEYLAF